MSSFSFTHSSSDMIDVCKRKRRGELKELHNFILIFSSDVSNSVGWFLVD